MSDGSESLRSLTKNERPLAIRSGRSPKRSNHERFAQVAHQKWANEWIARFLEWIAHSRILFFSMFYIHFFYFKNEQIAHSLFFGEQCEWIAQVTHQKWAMWVNRSVHSPKMSDHEQLAHIAQRKWVIVSESLRSLTKNEWMSETLIFWGGIAHSLIFGQKTNDSLEIPMSEFPALHVLYIIKTY